jgi:hypothetical protein
MIGGSVQFGLEGSRIQRQAWPQHERACIHASRDLPAQFAEALAHLVVQVHHVWDQESQQERRARETPRQQTPAPASTSATSDITRVVIVVAQVLVVFDSGHGLGAGGQVAGCDNMAIVMAMSLAQRHCMRRRDVACRDVQSAGVPPHADSR